MRKLATLEIIEKLSPIPDSDNIETASVRGWSVVVKKGEFEVGDLCVYFEIDSFLPIDERYEFLRKSSLRKMSDGKEGFRIKTIKLRGQISQGLVLPISSFPEVGLTTEIGQDLSELLNVEKYEPIQSLNLAGDISGNFPFFITKTDEERIQNLKRNYEGLREKTYYLTEKLDGTSFTAYRYNDEIGVCSRNYKLKESSSNVYWNIFNKYNIEHFLKSLSFNVCVQGEIVGTRIQGNPYKIDGLNLYVFNLINIDENKRYNIFQSEYRNLLEDHNLHPVPLLKENFYLHEHIEDLINYANGFSVLNNTTIREGLVCRSYDFEEYTSFKVISNQFLLKQKD